MESVLGALLVEIKTAMERDAVAAQPQVGPSFATLLPALREALATDEAESDTDEADLAARVTDALPRITAKLRQAYLDTRDRIARDFPWTLPALDWEMDLLGPLSKARSETVHTQCLAYLLDARSPHGLGNRVVRQFFRLLGRLIPGEATFDRLADESEESGERLRHLRVTAEQAVDAPVGTSGLESRRCDLWLELVEEGRALIVVIENKVGATEHDDQLAAYEQVVWKWAKDRRLNSFEQRLVFLTPDGRSPAEGTDKDVWLAVSYRQLAAALAHAARDAPEPGRTFLMLYVSTLLKHVMRISSHVDEINFAWRLVYMSEIIEHGASHA